MRRFSATLDSQARQISFVVVLIVVIPIFVIVSQYLKLHDRWLLLGPALVTAGLGVTALFYVKEYHLDGEALHIIRPVGAKSYPLHRFRSIVPVTTKELGFGIRTFGSGGFLGYFGMFYYRKHGHMTLYVTDRTKMLLITLEDERKIIISPDDPAAFIAAFSELTKR